MTEEGILAGEQGNADIRAALERITASPDFDKSPQLVSFLRFVVGATLAGRSRQIKAYTIATDALGRDARFDPQADPIVRVEAGRLRRALARYYANGGREDPIAIELPRGGYVPVFRANRVPPGLLARLQVQRRQFVDALHDNYRLLILIVVIAATVSVSFDLLWMEIGKMNETEQALQSAPLALSPSGPHGSHIH